jgi:16S rRNA (adenine1518-N6/adenine1519-N6)-dimethyltransferase
VRGRKGVPGFFKSLGIFPKKGLGQHFLRDESVSDAILTACEAQSDDVFVEIGAGLGILTIPLSQKVKKVFAIELDEKLAKVLKDRILLRKTQNVEVVTGNALDFDFHEISTRHGKRLKAIGNLPYNISTPVLFKLIKSREAISLAVFMFQKEVSDRIVAGPGNKSYGILSVLCQYFSRTEAVIDVSPQSFYPRPKVHSAVVSLRFGFVPDVVADDETLFGMVVKAAFGKRRKMLKNALSSNLNLSSDEIENLLTLGGIDGRRRAETLSVDEFVKLSNLLKKTYPHVSLRS